MKKTNMIIAMIVLVCGVFLFSSQTARAKGNPTVRTTVERINTERGVVTITTETIDPDQAVTSYLQSVDQQNDLSDMLLSATWFSDDLNATCSSGAQFKYSTTSGNSQYTLYWQGGSFGNTKSCGGSSCNFTITTSWSAYYTNAQALVNNPTTIWGPPNAYTCK